MLLHHGLAERPVSRGWQGQIQCRCGVGLSSEHEVDQVDVHSPDQVSDRIPGPLDNVGMHARAPWGADVPVRNYSLIHCVYMYVCFQLLVAVPCMVQLIRTWQPQELEPEDELVP